MARGFCYLVAIMDWATRAVLSWRLATTLEADSCVEALEEALERFGAPQIFNTDQGVAIHLGGLHRRPEGPHDRYQHGWQGTLAG